MSYVPIDSGTSIINEVDTKEEPWQYDSYGRLRVSNVFTLFESHFSNSEQSHLWQERIVGNGNATHNELDLTVDLSTEQTSDDITLQSKKYIQTRLGKSQLVFLGTNFKGSETGTDKKAGFFDDDNGVYFKVSDNGLELVLRTNNSGTATEKIVPRSDWDDPLDGSGESGYNINLNADQVFVLDVEWIGTGKIKAGILDDGKIIYAYSFKFNNQTTIETLKTVTLPVRFQITSISSDTLSNMSILAAVAVAEGGNPNFENKYTVSNEVAPKQIGSSLNPVLSIRPEKIRGNKINRISSILKKSEIFTESNDVYYELRINSTLSGTFWNNVGIGQSVIEFDHSADSATGGEVISKGYISANNVFNEIDNDKIAKHILTVDFEGEDSDCITLFAKTLDNSSTDVFATFTWNEDY